MLSPSLAGACYRLSGGAPDSKPGKLPPCQKRSGDQYTRFKVTVT